MSERKRGHQDQRALRAGLRSTVNDIERVKIKDQVKDGVARAMPYTLSADTYKYLHSQQASHGAVHRQRGRVLTSSTTRQSSMIDESNRTWKELFSQAIESDKTILPHVRGRDDDRARQVGLVSRGDTALVIMTSYAQGRGSSVLPETRDASL